MFKYKLNLLDIDVKFIAISLLQGSSISPILAANMEDMVNNEMEIIKKKKKDTKDDAFLVNTFYELDLAKGFYAEQLRLWFEKFPKKNILLISSEDLSTDTNRIISEIFEFLEVPKQEISDLTKQNKIKYPKMKDSTREVLINFFKPHNEKLFEMLDSKFDWDK